MKMHSLLIVSSFVAALAFAAPPAFALDTMSAAGPSFDASHYGQSYIGDPLSGGDYILVNPAGLITMHGPGLVDFVDSINLVAMNDSITDDAWLEVGGVLTDSMDMTLVNPHGVGLGTSQGGYHVIQMLPATFGDIAMLKNGAACADPGGSEAVLDTKSAFDLGGSPLGHMLAFGALGWSGSSAIPAAGCNINDAWLPDLAVG